MCVPSTGVESHVANPDSVSQRGNLVAGRDEFLSDVSSITGREQDLHQRRVIYFLRPVDFVAPRHARGVNVTDVWGVLLDSRDEVAVQDRKSTRLNSSHSQISYAVFCLKKKNTFCGAFGSTTCRAMPLSLSQIHGSTRCHLAGRFYDSTQAVLSDSNARSGATLANSAQM